MKYQGEVRRRTRSKRGEQQHTIKRGRSGREERRKRIRA